MIYSFGSLQLDLSIAELRAGGERRPVECQVFALLAYLIEHRDRLVSETEFFDKLWESRMVADSTLWN